MSLIKCTVTTCRYYNNDTCTSPDIDVGKKDAIAKSQTVCETYRKRMMKKYDVEIGAMDKKIDHGVCCEAKNCKYNEKCCCMKPMIEIKDEEKKLCKSFKLEK